MKNKVTKAIIPAGGFGTRFLPASKSIPKEMFPIIDKPTIHFIVEEAIKSGITDILIIVSSNKNSILDYFDYNYELEQKLLKANKTNLYNLIRDIPNMVNIQYVRQKEALGLGHAIMLAESFANNEPIAILLGDDVVFYNNKQKPAIKQCIEAFEQTNSSIVGVQPIETNQLNKYGIIDPKNPNDLKNKDLFELKGMVEKPAIKDAPSNYAILGRYVLTNDIFKELKKTKFDKNNEIELTNAILGLLKHNKVYAKVFEGDRFDIGSKLGYVKSFIYQSMLDNDIKDEILTYIKTFNK